MDYDPTSPLPIYVPSRDRGGYDTLMRGTLKYVPKAERGKITYVVPVEQVAKYQRGFRTNSWDVEVLGVPTEYDGIAFTRYWIGQHAAGKGAQAFLMLDDDVKFFKRKSATDTALEYQDFDGSGHDWKTMLHDVRDALCDNAVVGISQREGNNRQGIGSHKKLRVKNTRLLRCFAFRVEEFLAAEHGRVKVMEDFDVFLQIMRAGHDTVNLCWWAQDQAQTSAPGGCSVYRTHQLHEESARELARLHPEFVTLRQKNNKTGGEFGSRTEVTIQWKSARASADA